MEHKDEHSLSVRAQEGSITRAYLSLIRSRKNSRALKLTEEGHHHEQVERDKRQGTYGQVLWRSHRKSIAVSNLKEETEELDNLLSAEIAQGDRERKFYQNDIKTHSLWTSPSGSNSSRMKQQDKTLTPYGDRRGKVAL